MNTFIIYVALPALFFNLLSRTPIEQLAQWRFVVGATFGTYTVSR
jgi:malonate transporter